MFIIYGCSGLIIDVYNRECAVYLSLLGTGIES